MSQSGLVRSQSNASRSVAGGEDQRSNAQQSGRALSMNRTLHDRETYMQKKVTESAPFFRDARVQTCSHIEMKNGIAVAVAFPLDKTGWKHPNSYANTKRSSQVDSWARSTYQERPNQHAGMTKKPLAPYHPNSYRSRLPQATVVMPYKNSSQIVIGDRSTQDKRQFRSTNALMYQQHNLQNAVTNGGILASQTKWNHYQQLKQ